MTIQQQIRMLTQIFKEDGIADDDEKVIAEKIRLLEQVIQNPERYKECDHLPSYARYLELLRIAKEVNYNDAKAIEEWKIPIERKIEESQERLNNVAPALLEEAIKKEKRNIYVGIIGREEAARIQGKGLTLDAEVEALKTAAKKVNPTAVELLDKWDLSEEQRDYIFVQRVLNNILNGDATKVEVSDIMKLKAIKDKIEERDESIEDSHIMAEMRKLLRSSSMNMVFEMVERKKMAEAKENTDDMADGPELGEK